MPLSGEKRFNAVRGSMESHRYLAAAIGKSRPAAMQRSRNLTKGLRATSVPRRTDRSERPEFQIRRRQMAASPRNSPPYTSAGDQRRQLFDRAGFGAVGGNGGP